MTDDEHESVIARAFPMDYEPWRAKRIEDLTDQERAAALRDAERAFDAAVTNMLDPDASREEVLWAYEARLRAQHRIEALKMAGQRFDVV